MILNRVQKRFSEMKNNEFCWQGENRLSHTLTETEKRPLYCHSARWLSAMFEYCFVSPSGRISALKSNKLPLPA